LDYPLLGLKPSQILEIQKWLSDRYNENCLIELGILKFEPEQRDQDNFVTEAYLAGQYQGNRKTWLIPDWQDGIFLPAFRLPFDEELSALPEVQKQGALLKEYSFTKKDFLWRWNYYFLTEISEKEELILHLEEDLSLRDESDYPLDEPTLAAAVIKKKGIFIDAFLPPFEALKKREKYYINCFPEKDRYGHLEFTIVGTNYRGRPIGVYGVLNSPEDKLEVNKVYYLAYSKILKGKFPH